MADDEVSPPLENPDLTTSDRNDLIIADTDSCDEPTQQNFLETAESHVKGSQEDGYEVIEDELRIRDKIVGADGLSETKNEIDEKLGGVVNLIPSGVGTPNDLMDVKFVLSDGTQNELGETEVDHEEKPPWKDINDSTSFNYREKENPSEANYNEDCSELQIDEKSAAGTPNPKFETDELVHVEYETKEIKGFSLKVPKCEADLARKLGFNPFCYIRQENTVSIVRAEVVKTEKNEVMREKPVKLGKDTDNGNAVPVECRKRKRSKTCTPTPTTSSLSSAKPVAKKVKLISESCKVCGKSMRDREFLPDRETFYCSTNCISRKVASIAKTMPDRDGLLFMDRKGRKYTGETPTLKKLEAFLLRNPSLEAVVKAASERPRDEESTINKFRQKIRGVVQKVFVERFKFHDIYNTHRAKELGFQVEFDLFNECKSVRDDHYQSWFKVFIRCVKNCGKTFLDILIDDPLKLSELVKLNGKQLEDAIQILDTIEGPSDVVSEVNTAATEVEPTKPIERKPIQFDLLKKKFTPLARIAKIDLTVNTGAPSTAVDDILGDAMKDTTSKHGSHLYDANCQICSRKNQDEALKQQRLEKLRKKEQEERDAKEREREKNKIKRMNGRSRNKRSHKFSDDDAAGNDSHGFEDFDVSDILTGSPFEKRGSPHILKRDFDEKRSPFCPEVFSPEALVEKEKRRENWRNVSKESAENNVLANNVIWNGRVTSDSHDFDCNLLLVRNKNAYHLKNDMGPLIVVKQSVEKEYVYKQIDRLRNKWDRHLISLLMQPPQDSSEYQSFVNFYNELNRGGKMVVVNPNRSSTNITDMYFYALPPGEGLHPILDRQDGPGLMDFVRKCGNIMALIIRKATPNRESWRSVTIGRPPGVEKHETFRDLREIATFSRGSYSRQEGDLQRPGPLPSLAPPSLAPPLCLSPQKHQSPESFYDSKSPNFTVDVSGSRFGNGFNYMPGLRKRSLADLTPPRRLLEGQNLDQLFTSKEVFPTLKRDTDPLNVHRTSVLTDKDGEGKLAPESPKPLNLALDALDNLNSLMDDFDTRRSRNMNGLREKDENAWVRALVDDPTKLPLTFETLMDELKKLKLSRNIRLLSDAYYCFHTMKTAERVAIEDLIANADDRYEEKPKPPVSVMPILEKTDALAELKTKKGVLPVLPPLPMADDLSRRVMKTEFTNSSPEPPPPPPPPPLELGEIDSRTQSPIDTSIIPPPPPPPRHLDINWTPPPPPPVPPPMRMETTFPSTPNSFTPLDPYAMQSTPSCPVQPPPLKAFPSGIEEFAPIPPFHSVTQIPLRTEPVQIPIDTFDNDCDEGEYCNKADTPFKKFKEEKNRPFKHLKPQPLVDIMGRTSANNIPVGKGVGEIFGMNGHNNNDEQNKASTAGSSRSFHENGNPLNRLLPQPVIQRTRGQPGPATRGNFMGSPRGCLPNFGLPMPYPLQMPGPPRGVTRGRGGRGGLIPRGASFHRPLSPIRPPMPGMPRSQGPPFRGSSQRGGFQPRYPAPPMRGFYR